MILFETGGLVALVLVTLWVYCIFDVISTDEVLVRNLPKVGWLLVVVLLPDVGSLAWLLLGRPPRASYRPGSTDYRAERRWLAPEDRPDFPARVHGDAGGDLDGLSPAVREREEAARLRMWEEQLKRREEEVRRREEGGPSPG